MTTYVTWDHLGNQLSPGTTQPHLVMAYHDQGHQIITNVYDSDKISTLIWLFQEKPLGMI